MLSLSDGRYMTNKQEMPSALEALLGLTVVECDGGNATGMRRYALCGEEVKEVFPFAVATSGVGMHSVDYEMLVPVLVKALQELAAKRTRKTKAE